MQGRTARRDRTGWYSAMPGMAVYSRQAGQGDSRPSRAAQGLEIGESQGRKAQGRAKRGGAWSSIKPFIYLSTHHTFIHPTCNISSHPTINLLNHLPLFPTMHRAISSFIHPSIDLAFYSSNLPSEHRAIDSTIHRACHLYNHHSSFHTVIHPYI